MSEPQPFKNYYGPGLAQELATRVSAVYPAFPGEAFVAAVVPQLAPLELKGRIAAFAAGLREHLPPDYAEAVGILLATLGPAHGEAEGMFNDGWFNAPIATFIERYGVEDFTTSMAAMHAITQRYTAEFAIRPFLLRDPDRTLAVLREWAHDESVHVRRLVSEGTRTRLPWAPRLPQFIADPTPVLELLEQLKDDPALYVRNSVANNLNDIAKDHPDVVLETAARWREGASEQRLWIIRRALRTLVKQGNPQALRLLDAGAPEVRLHALSLAPSRLPMGGTLAIKAEIESTAAEAQLLIIDYVMHFAGARQMTRPKVFKWRSQTLQPGERLQLTKNHSFRPVTVRRYYPGKHRVELQVNGVLMGSAAFELLAEPS